MYYNYLHSYTDFNWRHGESINISIYGSTVLLLDLGRFFSFLILYTVGRTPWTSDQPVARPLPTHRTTKTQNKRTQTSMPWVGFEPTIPAFERAKTFHALDRVIRGSYASLKYSCVVCLRNFAVHCPHKKYMLKQNVFHYNRFCRDCSLNLFMKYVYWM
jgi:hypothetical protein